MKKELIDYTNWLAQKRANPIVWNPEVLVNLYLNSESINSDAQGESRNVSQNEAKRELCPCCNSTFGVGLVMNNTYKCDCCGAEWAK
jgi:formate dehydrogenase maturation protein FdhE